MKLNSTHETNSSKNHQTDASKPEKRSPHTLRRIGAMVLAATLLTATSSTTKKHTVKNISATQIEDSTIAAPQNANLFPPSAGEEAFFSSKLSSHTKSTPLASGEGALFASEDEADTTAKEFFTLEDKTDAVSKKLFATEDEADAASKEPILPVAGVESVFLSEPSESSTFDLDSLSDSTVSKNGWDGPVLNAHNGLNKGPNGDETYYNLDMKKVVENMHKMGFKGEYWVREDGVKMFGDYTMVAADLDVHPRGSIVETSLGTGIVCDTGDFAKTNHTQLDIATNWKRPKSDNSKK